MLLKEVMSSVIESDAFLNNYWLNHALLGKGLCEKEISKKYGKYYFIYLPDFGR